MSKSRRSKRESRQSETERRKPGEAAFVYRRWSLVAVTCVVIALVGWRTILAPRARKDADGYNVVLITLDTLRADRLGCYGYDRAATPVIDRLASEGTRFAQVATSVPMTLPAHATIMTGLYPPRHGVRDNGTFRLTDDHETLAEVMQRNGYATAAFIAAFVLDERYGLSQGIDHYDDNLTLRYRLPTPQAPQNPDRPANVVVDSTLAWLQSRGNDDRPFFAWVHLFDAHQPYAAPEPFRSRYAAQPYDGEIAFVDAQIGRLIEGLASLGCSENTLVVFVGDHGEGLGDHGEDTHRQLIYESTIRVPLILHCPGVVQAGAVVDRTVAATVDVLPTILDLTGLDIPQNIDGQSLVSNAPDSNRVVYMETLSTQLNDGWAPLFGVRDIEGKYIDAPTAEFYDLTTDPNEQTNLLATRRDDVSRLADALKALRVTFPDTAVASAVTPTEEELKRLAALGYVVGPGASDGPRSQLDPKIMIQSVAERIRGIHLMQQGKPREAIIIFEKLIEQSAGGSSEMWSSLSGAQMMIGDTADAIRSGRRSVELAPKKPERWCALANQYLRIGNDHEADVCLGEAERLDPAHGDSSLIRARAAMANEHYADAQAHCRRAIDLDPVRCAADGNALLGLIHNRRSQPDDAARSFEAALKHDPRNGTGLLGLAEILALRGQRQRAIELCQLLIEGQPEFLPGGRLMGQLYFETGQPDIAINILRTVLQRSPSDREAHLQLARVLASTNLVDASAHHLERASALGEIDFNALRSDPAFGPVLDHPRVVALENTQSLK